MWVKTTNEDEAINLDMVDVVYLAKGGEIVAEMGKDEFVLGKYGNNDEAMKAMEGLFAAMKVHSMPEPSRKRTSHKKGSSI